MHKVILIILMITAATLGGSLFLYKGRGNELKKPINEQGLEQFSTTTEITSIPEDWQIYKSEDLGYSISYPSEFVLENNSLNGIMLLKPQDSPAVGPVNFIYVSVVPEDQKGNIGEIYNYNPQQYHTLIDLEVGKSAYFSEDENPDLNPWFTYERRPDFVIAGKTAKVFINEKPWEFPEGTTEIREILEDDQTIFIIGGYYGGEDRSDSLTQEEVESIIKTFRI